MKHSHTRLIASFTIGAIAAGLSTALAQNKPTVITPPAVNDGSNFSRAPFPAARPFDDTKAPDGRAIDQVPPNTPATNVEPAVPSASVTILQPAPAAPVAVGVVTEPALSPTGRTTVAVATSLDATTFAPTIRSTTMASRDQMLSDIEMRLTNSEKSMGSFRSSMGQMSAEARRQFNTAEEDVKEKAKALKKSLKAAKKANEAAWDSTRSQLAADYEAYAAAVARLDVAGGASTTTVR